MLFNSWEFLLFFPLVFFLYYALPSRHRWPMLLAASCLFYMAFVPKYILILFTTICVDYLAALWIEKSDGLKRKLFLYGSVIVTCLILFFFKYYDFFAVNVTALAQFIGWNYSVHALQLILPIGLSFHTFQSLSYVIEVYRGKQKAEKHFGIYALYVMFFPQLVAGPIERPQNLLHQFHNKVTVRYDLLSSGLKLVGWGLFKKAAVADRLSVFVDAAYRNPSAADPSALVIAFFFFYFQIYADFSGYSDIARGTARMLGIDLMKNFNLPYLATSLTDFWKRWHISLSTWLRDYVYEPLALEWRSLGHVGVIFALLITFFVSGFWHGAKWTFVAWGLLHGLILSSEVIASRFFKARNRIFPPFYADAIGAVRTFILVCVSYVFFRAASFQDAFFVLHSLAQTLSLLPENLQEVVVHKNSLPNLGESFYFALLPIVVMVTFEILNAKGIVSRCLGCMPYLIRMVTYQIAVLVLVLTGAWFHDINSFIYFQF